MNVSKSTLIATTFLIAGVFTAQAATLTDVNWQQNAAQIKQQHKSPPDEDIPTRLTYKSQLFKMDFHKEYLFNKDGQLVNVLYYKSLAATANNCLSDYEKVKAEIVQSFGEKDTEVKRYVDFDTADARLICKNTADGTYQLDTKWQTKNSTFSLVLATWKGQGYIGITYKPL
ncbi:hypothetical protein AADZ86_16920 [Colwelliaceae bacterium BS250]